MSNIEKFLQTLESDLQIFRNHIERRRLSGLPEHAVLNETKLREQEQRICKVREILRDELERN